MAERTSRIVFFGTPEAAATSLRALLERGGPSLSVVGVVTRAPKSVGRKQVVTKSPVHVLAEEHGIPVATPVTLDADVVRWLQELKPDVAVLVVYGKILPATVLSVPTKGFVNVHPSLLPLYRGPSPVVSALRDGQQQTGVTIMQLDGEVDHGPILAQQRVPVAAGVTGGQLTEQLAQVGAQLLVETLPRYLSGELEPVPQDHAAATFTHKLERASGALDWSLDAAALERTVRAYDPWPGTYTLWNGKRLKVLGAAVGTLPRGSGAPGTVVDDQGTPAVATADGWLRLTRLQLEGGAATDGAAFLRGHPRLVGARLAGGAPS